MKKFRELRADEIQVRIGQVAKDGSWITALLYKDARCDMNILDETVGAENWQCKYYECKGNLFCSVGIKVDADGDVFNQWIWKDDCGVESNTEKEKGEASDAFKRACFRFGLGRELYTAPFIYIPRVNRFDNSKSYYTLKDGKPDVKLSCSFIDYKNGKIACVRIRNDKTNEDVFCWKASNV